MEPRIVHDTLCEQRYQPYENDTYCRDCYLIAKVRRELAGQEAGL